MAGGFFRPGDKVLVLPSGKTTTVAGIDVQGGVRNEARAPQSVTLRLSEELDVGRSDLICHPDQPPKVGQELSAVLCWMSERPLVAGSRLLLKHTTRTVKAVVTRLEDRLDVNTLERAASPASLGLNDPGKVTLHTSAPLAWDDYRHNRTTGSFILIDEATHATVAGGMLG